MQPEIEKTTEDHHERCLQRAYGAAVIMFALVLAIATSARAQDFEILYDASAGTLPSAQSGNDVARGSVPNPTSRARSVPTPRCSGA